MNAFFTELGREVRARWQAANFSLEAFPSIAALALEERPPASHVDLEELVRDFLLEDEQPFQTSSGFGQPELVVYDDPRFYIQLLFWLDGTTQIHQHEFSGAFHVMAGSSIHSEFAFENMHPVTAHFRVGDLRLKHTELLETGSTVPIISGGACIHSLFHLETPSLTVVVRTHSDPGTGPQFTYLPPHVAVDPFFTDALTSRRTQLLDVLERTGNDAYADLVRAMVAELDFERGFFILQNGLGHLRNLGEWEETLEIFRCKHGPLADVVEPTLDEIVWRDTLVGLRSSVEEVEHRFFLALLLNVRSRAELLAFVARRFPGDPVETVLRWAEELMVESEAGVWLLDVEIDDEPEIFLAALRAILESEEIPDELADFGAALARSSLRALVS